MNAVEWAAANVAHLFTGYHAPEGSPVVAAAVRNVFKPSEGQRVIGMVDPEMRCGSLSSTTDFTSRPDRALVLLTNSTGSSVRVSGLSITGFPVIQRARGLEWQWSSQSSIDKDGETAAEIVNDYIIDADQLEAVGDYLSKDSAAAPVYSLAVPGAHWEVAPGSVWHLELSYTIPGMPSEAELIDTDVEVLSASVSRSAGRIGETALVVRPKPAAWAKTTSRRARLISAGVPQWLNNRGNTLLVASSTWTGQADWFCDGTADDVEIQAAIDFIDDFGGGTVALTPGVFSTTSKITLGASTNLVGSGKYSQVVTTSSIDMIEMAGAGSKIDQLRLTGKDSASYSAVVVSESGCAVTRCVIENKLEVNDDDFTQSGNTIIAGTT